MEIQDLLNNYKSVAHQLGNDSVERLVDSFITKNSNHSYEIPVIGQFSAGKSSTINHLLGRFLLPEKKVETTAFATFISYSDEEFAVLALEDGTTEQISVEDVKLLDNDRIVKSGKKVTACNVGIKNDLLKSGLTFVDTPGVNTIITTHIEITERILKDAQYIVYVVNKAITEEDLLMIQTIEARNIPVLYIRTYLDGIKESEEDWRVTVKQEKTSIEGKIGHPVKYFAITNNHECTKYEDKFKELHSFFTNDISKNVKEVFESAILNRLEPLKKELVSIIENKKQTLQSASKTSIAEIEKQKAKVEQLVEFWNSKIESQIEKVEKKQEQVSSDVSNDIHTYSDRRIMRFETQVKSETPDPARLTLLVRENMDSATSEINDIVTQTIQSGVNSVCRTLGEEMQSIGDELKGVGINFDCSFDMSVAEDYAERQRAVESEYEEKTAQIEALMQEIEHNSEINAQQKEELMSKVNEANEQVSQLESQYRNIKNSYSPQYIEKKSKAGSILGTVGKVLDIAMLIIPAAGWAKIGKAASKIGKSGSFLNKIGKGVGKGMKFIAQTDKVKDASTLLGGLTKNNGEKKTGVFDFLSLSHWFEKAGEKLDPTKYEKDMEYEQMFNAECADAKAKIDEATKGRLAIIENLSRLNDDSWKEKQKKAELEKQASLFEAEKQKIKEKIESEKEAGIRNSLQSQAISQFSTGIKDYCSSLEKRSKDMIYDMFGAILESANMKTQQQLTSLSSQLSEIVEKKSGCQTDLESDLKSLDSMVNMLSKN